MTKDKDERYAEMERLRKETPEDCCNYGWYVFSEDAKRAKESGKNGRDWLRDLIPEVCGQSPCEPTDAPMALRYNITRVCSQHSRDVIMQEQLEAALKNGEASRQWLVDHGHTVYTWRELFPEDVEVVDGEPG